MQSINPAGTRTSEGCKNVQMPTRPGHMPAESSFGPGQTYAKISRKIRSDDCRTPSLIFLGPIQDRVWCHMYVVVPSILTYCELHHAASYPPFFQAKTMLTEGQLSSTDEMTAFATQLCRLCADQNPVDLSNTLRDAIKERKLYNAYVSSLVDDTERMEMLLEIFDKVCSMTCAIL